jgi:tripartite-type tricarboxylate transporter receptor subunit TctC
MIQSRLTAPRRRSVIAVLAAFAAAPSMSQTFPAHPVKIVVPFAPGGSADAVARVIASRAADALGQSVVVENRPGGGTVIGAGLVAKAAPDGYTMLLTSNPHTSNPSLFAKLPYDTVKDFQPLTMVGVTPLFVVVHPSLGVSTVTDLVALLKAHPNKYSYGSSGNAGPPHLAGEMFKTVTHTSIVHVPFKGGGPAAVALIAGEVQIGFTSPTGVMPYVKNGRLKALAVMTAARSSFAPEVPALSELGYPEFDMAAWMGLFLPAGTPPDVVARLHQAIRQALSTGDARETLAVQGIEPLVSRSPEEFGKFIQADLRTAAKIIKEADIRVD